MKQKILAIFLSVVMLLGMLPVGIIAGATDGDAAESTLPAGTVGYFMDVPKEEQYISQKVNGLRCLKYTQYLFVKNNTKTAADPFSDSLTDDDSYYDKDNGGLFVRVIDGEEFMVINPIENVVADYTTTSEVVTTETTAEDGTITQWKDTVVTGTTTLRTNSGQRNRHIGRIYYNGISSIDNTSITSDVSGLPLISDDKEAGITHLAFRIKVIGGHKDQKSAMWTPDTSAKLANYCSDIYFVDANTGEITKNIASDVIVLPYGDFDGYMVTPIDLANLQASNSINLYTFAESSTDWKSSDWAGRVLCMGDAYAVTDSDVFAAQFVPGTVPTLDFTVTPEANDKLVVTNDTDPDKKILYSIDGENWYDVDAFNALTFEGNKYYTVYAKYSWLTNADIESKTVYNAVDTATMIMPAVDKIYYPSWNYGTYGLGYSSSQTMRNSTNTGWTTNDANQYLYATTLDGERYWNVVDNPDINDCRQFQIYPFYKKTAGEVYSDAAERFSHFAVRIRIEEDGTNTAVEGAVYSVSMNLFGTVSTDSNYDEWSGSGAYFYDITTGEKLTVNRISYSLPLGFNGYLIIPSTATVKGTAYEGDNPDTTKVETSYNLYEKTNISDFQKLHVFMHNGDHYSDSNSNWTGVTLYLGDMELIEDDTAFIAARSNCAYTGIHDLQAVEAKAPSADDAGYFAHYACTSCGATYSDDKGTTEVNPTNLAFDAASLTLEQNIAVNFKANAENLTGLTNVYAKFTFNGIEKIVKAGTPDGGKYVFTFDGIGPHLLGKTITAQLFGTYEGTVYSGAELEYSVKDYCYNMLAEYENIEGTKAQAFRTLLVDLLNYGSKAQIHTQTDVLDLVNEDLGHLGTINRTVAAPDVTTGTKGIYDDLADEDTLATWKGVNLYFEETVGMMFRFTTDSLDGVTVKVTDAEGTLIEEITSFTVSDKGGYIAYFDGLNAAEMRKNVRVAVYQYEEKVSDTLAYDVVSYAKEIVTKSYVSTRVTTKMNAEGTVTYGPKSSWPGDSYKTHKALVSFMMRYGDAVENYVAVNA